MRGKVYRSAKQIHGTGLVVWLFSLGAVWAQTSLSVPQLVRKVRPSVVQIVTRQISYGNFLRPIPSEGVGSGVIFNSSGHIWTNSHVLGDADPWEDARRMSTSVNINRLYSLAFVAEEIKLESCQQETGYV